MDLLLVAGVDISHFRLVDLAQLADRAKPFYDWVERQFQQNTNQQRSLDEFLHTMSSDEIKENIEKCYRPTVYEDIPHLFDGIGRTYPHSKACFYFFSWLIRDAPQQRLSPLIQRVIKNSSLSKMEAEIAVLTALIDKYRTTVKTFQWEAIREIIIDRLEGSRRSIRGHEKEAVVRKSLGAAIQTYFELKHGYGNYADVDIPEGQVTIGNETYDVSMNLRNIQGEIVHRILVPIKTRETEGGGHSHLFTRDILSALSAARNSGYNDYLIAVIVANQWSEREARHLAEIVDHLVHVDLSSAFTSFNDKTQSKLNEFIFAVLEGRILPKGTK